jgi:molecular chaperone GrpE
LEPESGSGARPVDPSANDLSPQAGAEAPAAGGPDPSAELLAARAKAAENYDLFLRARADLENQRRRAQEDVAKTQKYAIESFAETLVPVVDSLQRALETGGTDANAVREGVRATLKQLLTAFERARLVEIDPAGQKFDPHRHQAIATVPVAGGPGALPANHVVTVHQKGWMIAERVLRPAMVSVSKGAEGAEKPPTP